MSPLVSIVIPIYNRESLIKETIDSVKSQSFSNWELLLIDDGSTDDSVKIAEDIAGRDSRIIFLHRNRSPKGAPTCRNIGLENAKGKYIQFFDSDDLMLVDMIQQKVQYLEEVEDLDFVVSKMADLYEDGKVVYTDYSLESDYPFCDMLKSNLRFLTPGPLFRKKYLEQFSKGFDERLTRHQEWEYYCRLLSSKPEFKVIDEFHCLRRLHAESIKGQSDKSGNLAYRSLKLQAVKYLNENTNGRYMKTLYDVFRPYVVTTLKVALYQGNVHMVLKSIIWLAQFRIFYLTVREN